MVKEYGQFRWESTEATQSCYLDTIEEVRGEVGAGNRWEKLNCSTC